MPQSDDEIDENNHAKGDAARVSNVSGDAASDVSGDAASDINGDAASDVNGGAASDIKSDAGSDSKSDTIDTVSGPAIVPIRRKHGILLEKALTAWERKYNVKAYEEENVRIMGWFPPVCLMDSSLARLKRCRRLSLSTNIIRNISNLNYMEHLKILSLGRNQIQSLSGITAVKGTLEELWVSHNRIDKLEGLEELDKLKVIYMGYNNVSLWSEVERMVSNTS
ncbi:dynein light chain 1, axonemal-like [Pecten maximus]|uniref:dynein light chain 1, axonemal-like n=1 Tax=Pecten maximus TaxID=6579 RepID=UPI0014583E6F|nr:dynein light chain 1, axonemal-like [Pecten maximus]